ncbi:MAG: TIGR04282 family arsenosugar biosynthesis glycosyltransferase [Bryobacteraceae bacterium]
MLAPVVIVFAKAPIAGHVKTRLGLPPQQALALHERFVEATLATCAELALCTELHTDQPTDAWPAFTGRRSLQSDGDLGQRMRTALESHPLESHSGGVMIVGSDAPTLPPDHLRRLLSAASDVALGPAEDGGYYAIFARKTHPAMFAGVEWSSGRELRQTVTACEACGLTVELGEPWFDIDTLEDLRRLPAEFLDRAGVKLHL